MNGYLPGNECAICQGKCCKEHGCVLAPSDVFDLNMPLTEEKVLEILTETSGLYAIDRTVTSAGMLYYLRMRHKCYTFIGIDAIGECVALTDEGCSLSYEKRPTGGRMLKSSPDFHCIQEYDLDDMIKDWMPYNDILADIWKEYEGLFYADGTFDRCDEAYFAYIKSRS